MRPRILACMLLMVVACWAVLQFVVGPLFHQGDSGSEVFARTETRRVANQRSDQLKQQEADSGSKELEDDTRDRLNVLLARWQSAVDADQYDSALELAEKMLELAPENAMAQQLFADTLFYSGNFDRCVEEYDQLIEMQPVRAPDLWQRGLALYYAKRFKDGKAQFESHQTVNSQDVENAVWHCLCAAQCDSVKEAQRGLIDIQYDGRIPMAEVHQLFAGKATAEQVLEAAKATTIAVEGSTRHKIQRYYALLYISLFQEMKGDQAASLKTMQEAAESCPLPKTNFMGQVARVHLLARGAEKPGAGQ